MASAERGFYAGTRSFAWLAELLRLPIDQVYLNIFAKSIIQLYFVTIGYFTDDMFKSHSF